jgi:soluble lytic murein transglycosylase
LKQWIKQFGDPRDPDVDAVDWIEMIPFTETRNYVQRILENVQVYRLRLADTEVALRLEEDLNN